MNTSTNVPHESITCPYTGHKKKCCKLYTGCPKWVRIDGFDHNTGKQIDQYGCVDTFQPKLQIEQANQIRELGAAVESFRNIVADGITQLMTLASASASVNKAKEISHD